MEGVQRAGVTASGTARYLHSISSATPRRPRSGTGAPLNATTRVDTDSRPTTTTDRDTHETTACSRSLMTRSASAAVLSVTIPIQTGERKHHVQMDDLRMDSRIVDVDGAAVPLVNK